MLEQGKTYRFIHTRTSPLIIEAAPVGKNGSHEWLVQQAGRQGHNVFGQVVAGGFLGLDKNGDNYVYQGGPRMVRDSSQSALEAALERGEIVIY